MSNDRTNTAGFAVVTGAGSGLGRAMAIELAERRVIVAGFGRREQPLVETAGQIRAGQFFPMVVDVADGRAVASAFSEITANHGPISLLINNAAIYPRRDFLEETSDSFQHTVNVNLGGVVNCTQAALETMCQTGVGRIVNVASFADVAPMAASSAYSVSKGAARILTRALVADLGDRFPDIIITDWLPGMLATQMGISEGLDPAIAARWGVDLALWHDPSLNGAVFEQDRELLPPQSLKRRVLNKLLLRKSRIARRIGR